MAGYSVRYENLAKKLIYHILGFEEEDKDFEASINFVMSNLLYHHCLDVNSHHVQRSLQGISFKMGIHGHQKKGERLNNSIEKFLMSPDVEEQGDLKWSILSLLVELSQHPARDSLTSSLISNPDCGLGLDAEGSEEESWIQELMEKSFQLPDRDDTLSEWSDDEELRHSLSLGNKSDELNGTLCHVDKSPKGSEEKQRHHLLIKETHLAKSRISNVIQRPYWNAEAEKLVIACDNLHEESGNLTEYCVMRECVWLLLHPSSGYVFQEHGKEIIVIPGVTLSSISEATLQKLLQPITCAASKLREIDTWLQEMRDSPAREEREHWGTLECYSEGLRTWRRYFSMDVKRLEDVITGQDGSPTLLWFLSELEPRFSNLSIIYDIHSKAFSRPQDSAYTKSFKLLSLLMQSVESDLKCADRSCVSVLLNYALRNHCRCLSAIMCAGSTVSDGMLNAFCIQRTATEGSKFKTFTLKDDRCTDLPGLRFLTALRQPLIEICKLAELDKDLKITEDIGNIHLEQLIHKEIFGNKFSSESQELLSNKLLSTSNICTKKHVNSTNAEDTKEESIKENGETAKIDDLCRSKEECKNVVVNNMDNVQDDGIEMEANGSIEKETVKELESRDDMFLKKAFEDCEENHFEDCDEEIQLSSFECCDFTNTMRLEQRLTNALLPVVERCSTLLGKVLMSSLIANHGMKQQIKAFKSIVLLSSVDMMNEFYSYLFHKIDSKEHIEEGDLTQSLQYSISFSHPKLAKYFGVTLANSSNKGIFATEVFSSISIDFGDLWPLSLIVSETSLTKYNKIFVFCLMLKRAAFTLERLHFKEIASFEACYREQDSRMSTLLNEDKSGVSPPFESPAGGLSLPQRIHRLQLLRQWLLYFSRLLHDHFCTAIFVPFSQGLDKLLETEHFADFVKEHEKLLNSVCHQCLFTNDKLSPIQNALTQIFSAVENVRELWNGPPSNITEAKLDNLDEQYATCHRFIENFLSTLALTRLCPLVEGLANSLSYNCPA